MKKPFLLSIFIIVFILQNVYGWDNSITHPTISKEAINRSILDIYLKSTLNFQDGVNSTISGYTRENRLLGKTIIEHIQEGSFQEDEPNCRASNHFHNPRLSWDIAGVKDLLGLIRYYCEKEGEYPPGEIVSTVQWATGYIKPAPGESGDVKPGTKNKYDWDHAREYYYTYLTGKDFQGLPGKYSREISLSESFKALGYVMHLLQDMAVPAHVRDDFMSHKRQ